MIMIYVMEYPYAMVKLRSRTEAPAMAMLRWRDGFSAMGFRELVQVKYHTCRHDRL